MMMPIGNNASEMMPIGKNASELEVGGGLIL